MVTAKYDRSVQLNLLDRLIDSEPDQRSEPVLTRAESLRRFRASVKRDLEWLFNTTRAPIEVPESQEILRKSLLFYGLSDISSFSLRDPADEQRLVQALETAIETFEPRLTRIRVTRKEIGTGPRQVITFHVEAILLMDPVPERIAFDTVLEVSKGAYTVEGS